LVLTVKDLNGQSPLVNRAAMGLALWVMLLGAFFVMAPAISGAFLFDDLANLEPLGKGGGVVDWPSAQAFILSGYSGPLGRPVSLASFLLNDQAWPSQPDSLRYTNILIHLLNGVLVFILLRTVFRLAEVRCLEPVALAVTALWVFHPIQQAPVFLVIQRMTLLSGTFCLLALIFYVNARCFRSGLLRIWGFLAVSLCCVVASMFSKENGVLFVSYALVLELVLLLHLHPPRGVLRLAATLVALGFGGLIAGLVWYFFNWQANGRDYTLYQGFLTQGRVLMDYLSIMTAPSVKDIIIFNDKFEFSRDLFNPLSTFFSWCFHLGLIAAAVGFRRVVPLVSLGVLWFYGGHLLESTVINLELYFLHRNYLPLLGFLVFGLGVCQILPGRLKSLTVALFLILLPSYALIGFANAKTWSNERVLLTNWHLEQPDSYRSARELAGYYAKRNMGYVAYDILLGIEKRHPEFLTSKLDALIVACNLRVENPFTQSDLLEAARKTKAVTILGRVVNQLYDEVRLGHCSGFSKEDLMEIIRSLLEDEKKHHRTSRKYFYLTLAKHSFESGTNEWRTLLGEGWVKFDKAADLKYLHALYLASVGEQREALEAIKEIETGASRKTYLEYKQDIDHLKSVLESEVR
jgi:hypothetical protein